MTIKQATNLKPGDKVYWNDPDDGLCSRELTIERIQFNCEVVVITDTYGDVHNVFANELSIK